MQWELEHFFYIIKIEVLLWEMLQGDFEIIIRICIVCYHCHPHYHLKIEIVFIKSDYHPCFATLKEKAPSSHSVVFLLYILLEHKILLTFANTS